MSLITLLVSLLFVNFSIAGYVLEDDYTPSNFFSMFSFFTSADPTNGFVDYVDQSTAESAGYISTTASTVYIGTDHENVTPGGRPSVRLTSNKSYNSGSLVILDLEHMPGGICGTWPAFWMVGPDWPSGGEIDIIEGVNEQTANAMTLHTNGGCSITNNGDFSGSISTYDCDVNASDQTANAGCSIDSSNSQTYGTGFNNVGGGVYATEWTNASISVWFFPRGSLPSDISAGSPDPSSWGTPSAEFQGGCDIDSFFHDNQIVFDLTYCGDWAGNVWSDGSCSSKADTCIDYVENNPTAFQNAYWTINSLQVFQYSSSSSASTTSAISFASSTALSTYPVVVSSSTATSSFVSTTSSTTESMTESSSPTSSSSVAFSSSSSSSTSLSSSSQGRWHGRSSSSSVATSQLSSASSVPLLDTLLGKAVTTATASSSSGSISSSSGVTTATPSSSLGSTSSSSNSIATSSSSLITATTLTVQTSSPTSVAPETSSMATIASLVVSPTTVSPAAGSASSAVPTSQAEILAALQEIAGEWSTSQPSNWVEEINEFEAAMEAASSQAAAVSAKLKSNQRRHLLQHKRRLSGHH